MNITWSVTPKRTFEPYVILQKDSLGIFQTLFVYAQMSLFKI